MEKQTIIQQIQPQCDNLYKNIKKAVNEQHKTHREIVEHTGIPRSSVAKFLSGALANPCVFYIAAICKYLNLSMDGLFDIEQSKEPDTGAIVAELEAQLDRANSELELVKHHNDFLESEIKHKTETNHGLLVSNRSTSLLLFLVTLALFTYLVMDIGAGGFGFFRDDKISLFGIVMIVLLMTAFYILAEIIIKRRNKGEKQ